MKMEQTECSETSAYKIRTPGNYPEESTKRITSSFTTTTNPFTRKTLHVAQRRYSCVIEDKLVVCIGVTWGHAAGGAVG